MKCWVRPEGLPCGRAGLEERPGRHSASKTGPAQGPFMNRVLRITVGGSDRARQTRILGAPSGERGHLPEPAIAWVAVAGIRRSSKRRSRCNSNSRNGLPPRGELLPWPKIALRGCRDRRRVDGDEGSLARAHCSWMARAASSLWLSRNKRIKSMGDMPGGISKGQGSVQG
jgi:hypothetical protein